MKNKFSKILLIVCFVSVLLTACSNQEKSKAVDGEVDTKEKTETTTEETEAASNIITDVQERQTFALNTFITVKLFEAPQFSDEDWQRTFEILADIENRMSAHIDTSEISEINKNAGVQPVKVSDDVFNIIKQAKDVAAETNGAFDPTIGALTKLWQIGTDNQHVPSQAEIDQALKKVDYNKLILNEKSYEVFLEEEGMAIDLGGIAKGYSADQVFIYLKSKGVQRAILDFGGNISLIGSKAEDKPWRVGVREPNRAEFKVYASIFASDESFVSSGDYERYFEEDGKLYHHIINPFTGYPTDNGIRGASVVLDSSMQADAYATALIVMGKEKAIDFIQNKGLEAILVYSDMTSFNTFADDRDFKLEK